MPLAAAAPYIFAAATTAAGVSSARSQASAARKATAAQVGAAQDQLSLDRAVAQYQIDTQNPQIRAGGDAQARQMLMLGYSPQQVKTYLQDTYASTGADALFGGDGNDDLAPQPQQRVPGQRRWNAAAGEWEPEFQVVSAPTKADTRFDWVEGYDPQAFLESTPGYQFRRNEGQQGVERSAAARGRLFSGATGKALTRYNQEYASGEWGNLFDQFGRLAGQGADAANTVVNVASNYGDAAGGALRNIGDARASGYRAQGEAKQNQYGAIAQGLGSIYGLGKQAGWFGA